MKITRTILLLATLFLMSLTFQPAAAQEENGIDMRVRAGFDGIRKQSGWLTFNITVSNAGPPVEGFLQVSPTNDGPVYRVPISLPTQSNKQVSLPFYEQRFAASYNVVLVDAEENVIERALVGSIKQVPVNDILFGVLSNEPGDFDFLGRVLGPRSSGDGSVAALTISDLPENPNAWADLDVLIVNGIDSNQLSTAQREAVRIWIGLGGQLVLTGGADWQQATAAFDELLPVTISGSQSVDDLPALIQATGEPFRDAGPYVITNSTLSGGQLLYHEGGLPILARREFGRGSVFFLALDPQFAPLKDWDGQRQLWDTIVDYTPADPVWADTTVEENLIQRAVEAIPSLTLPSSLFLLAFLSLYTVAVGPIAYTILKRRQRLESAWYVIPVIILLFSVVAYLFGFQVRGNRAVLNQISVVYGHLDAPEASVQSYVGVYSPRRTSYDLIFPDGTYTRPFDRAFTAFGSPSNQNMSIISGGDVTIQDLLVDIAGIESFVSNTTTSLPPLSATAEFKPRENATRGELDITVTNNSEITIEDATILVGNSSVKLGDIPPGETATAVKVLAMSQNTAILQALEGGPPAFRTNSIDAPVSQHYSSILGQSNYYNDPDVFARYQFLEGLTVDYYASAGVSYLPESVITLVGWSEEEQIAVNLDNRRYSSAGTTLYLIEIPVTR